MSSLNIPSPRNHRGVSLWKKARRLMLALTSLLILGLMSGCMTEYTSDPGYGGSPLPFGIFGRPAPRYADETYYYNSPPPVRYRSSRGYYSSPYQPSYRQRYPVYGSSKPYYRNSNRNYPYRYDQRYPRKKYPATTIYLTP